MSQLEDLKTKALDLGIELKGDEKIGDLKVLIKSKEDVLASTPQELGGSAPATQKEPKNEKMVPLSDVKRLIAEELERQKGNPSVIRPSKVSKHFAHVWRFDGKWVTDFVDRNINKETGEPIDAYIKQKVHSYNVFNEQRREFEAWIEIKFEDGSTKALPLKRYLERRIMVHCEILKREKIDLTYSIGTVEKKKEVGDRLVSSGQLVEQEVYQFAEVFTVKTPEGAELVIPDYAIA